MSSCFLVIFVLARSPIQQPTFCFFVCTFLFLLRLGYMYVKKIWFEYRLAKLVRFEKSIELLTIP
jgi:hypothetical protein